MQWKDQGYLFGTTFANKRALKKEKNDAGQVRIVVQALNERVEKWEPIYATAPFENERAYEKFIDSKVSMDCCVRDPELAIAFLLHNFLYGDDFDSWDRRKPIFDEVAAKRERANRAS